MACPLLRKGGHNRVWPMDTISSPNLVNFSLLLRGEKIYSGYLIFVVARPNLAALSLKGWMNFGPLFREHKFSTMNISTLFVVMRRKWSALWVWLMDMFGELRSGGPVMPCGNMHQSFTDALVMVALCNRADHYIFAL